VEISRNRIRPLRKMAEFNGLMNSRIFVIDQNVKTKYLMDTSADVYVFSRSTTNCACKSEYMLNFENEIKIDNPIICIYFLVHYNLLVDAKNKMLIKQQN
jgi:hypothetical protein